MEFLLADAMEKGQKINTKVRGIVSNLKIANENYYNIEEVPSELYAKDSKIKVVFVGQYSAGKSTILKMLTGERNIAVGAGITTQISSVYEWKNMEVVDTPGIATGIRFDHDKIAYDAIAKADLLVFVITNELFTPIVLENFKKLAYDLEVDRANVQYGKANEMILVVNKMERIGNTSDKQKMLREELYKSGVPENIAIGFVDAQSFVETWDENDQEVKEELIEASGYKDFINLLNSFAEAKGLKAKVISPLKNLQDYIYKIVDMVEAPLENPKAEKTQQLLKSSIKTLKREDRNGRRNLLEIFSKYAHEIRTYGSDIANDIENMPAEDIVKNEINERISTIINNCKKDVEDELLAISDRIEKNFECVFEEGFTGNIPVDIARENVQDFDYSYAVKGLKEITEQVLAIINKDLILKIGHFLGHKFKPWEAVKYFKWIGKLNKWIPLIGQIANTIMDIWDHNKQEEARHKLEEMKREIRASFNEIACDLENDGRAFVNNEFGKSMDKLINKHIEELSKFDKLRDNNNESCFELKKCAREIAVLVKGLQG